MKYILLIVCVLSFPDLWGGKNSEKETRTGSALQAKANSALNFCRSKGMNTDFCFLVDMRIHSGKNRLFIWSFKENRVLHAALCCHGAGGESTKSQPVFSNVSGSNCTSLGKYELGVRSYSQYGIHIHYKMHGLESTNSNAYKRDIVFHSHTPVPESECYPHHLTMGWSLGCPVISNKSMKYVDSLLSTAEKPVLMWIYY